jgi:[ribosomal protein S5]-alanine N-acetyltransferase
MASSVEPTTSSATAASASEAPAIIATYGNVYLRILTIDDAPLIAAQANNPKIAANMRNRFPSPYTLEDAVFWLNLRAKDAMPHKHCGIFRAADGVYMGGIGLIPGEDIAHRTWEIGYWMGEEFWGHGYMTDAVKAYTPWTFETFPQIVRLEAGAFDTNVGSQKVLAKSGFTFEGRRRNAVEKHGKIIDIMMYSMLREESLNE